MSGPMVQEGDGTQKEMSEARHQGGDTSKFGVLIYRCVSF